MQAKDTQPDGQHTENAPTTDPDGPPQETPEAATADGVRPYLRITPTDTSVGLETVHTQFRRLYDLAWHKPEQAGGLRRLARNVFGTGRTPRPIEWLLVTDGDPTHPLQYYVGLDGVDTGTERSSPVESPQGVSGAAGPGRESDLDALRRIARAIFPNDYQTDVVRWHPRALLRDTPETAAADPTGDTEAIDTTDEAPSNDEYATDGHTTQIEQEHTTQEYTAVEFVGRATRRRDWQTRLVPLDAWADETTNQSRPPLSGLVEALADSTVPMVYQALLTPMESWAAEAADRRYNLLEGRDVRAERWARDFGLGRDDYGEQNREKLERQRGESDDPLAQAESGSPVHRVRTTTVRDADHSFVVTARVVVRGPPHRARALNSDVVDVFGAASGPYHAIEGRYYEGKKAETLCAALCARTTVDPAYERRLTALPGVANTSRGIVVDPREAPTFCLLDGGSLSAEAMAGIAPTPGERAQPYGPPPSRDLLSRYQGPGLTLGQFTPGWTTGVDAAGRGYHTTQGQRQRQGQRQGQQAADQTEPFIVRLPPALQRLHVAWFGKTGSGKTTGASIGIVDNHAATDGATIVIDQKGDGMADELKRIVYARTGSLDDVVHFDCSQVLPAVSFFDIRDQLAAGIPREVAVEDVTAHYGEMLAHLHADYASAGVSVKLIEAVLKAMFDPIHGQDAFSHREFRATISWMRDHHAAPAVSDPELEEVLADNIPDQARQFENIMTGVTNRVDEITLQTHLSTVLNHVAQPAVDENATRESGSEPESEVEPEAGAEPESGTESEAAANAAREVSDVASMGASDSREANRASNGGVGTGVDANIDTNANADVGVGVGMGVGMGMGEDTTPSADGESATDVDTTPDDEWAEPHAQPTLDLIELIDEDLIVVFDMGGLREEAQRAMTLLLLSNLWTALRRRLHRRKHLYGHGAVEAENDSAITSDSDSAEPRDETTVPLVNLHVEEAATVATAGVFGDLLKQARSFGCSVTLSMQYPGQLRHADPTVYDEVLNNVSTIITGNVPLDRDLAARLATSDMEPQEVANRLRALSRGEWLCALPADFGAVEPRPFVIESAPLPPGHPEGPHPLSEAQELHFEIAQVRSAERTRRRFGLTVTTPQTVTHDETGAGVDDAATDAEDGRGGADGDERAEREADETMPERRPRVDSALPYTLRLPETVAYNEASHALDCTECGNRYDPSDAGMQRAIACCSSLAAVDADDIPITMVNLKLSRNERTETELSDGQLMLLQAIHNAQQLRYDPPAYDLISDSMIRLLEYVGATSEDVQTLIDAEYLAHDGDHPHRLYSVTPAGRAVLGEAFREGVDYGHGQGDLEESSAHVLMVEAARRYLVAHYVDDPESPVRRVVPYYEIGDGHRLDLAGLDAEGEVVVAVEAERVNHDIRRAVPDDYDKMAACTPTEAIWVVMNRTDGHRVLAALNDPIEGDVRVEKTYSTNTPPDQFSIETPGLTAIYTVERILDRL